MYCYTRNSRQYLNTSTAVRVKAFEREHGNADVSAATHDPLIWNPDCRGGNMTPGGIVVSWLFLAPLPFFALLCQFVGGRVILGMHPVARKNECLRALIGGCRSSYLLQGGCGGDADIVDNRNCPSCCGNVYSKVQGHLPLLSFL